MHPDFNLNTIAYLDLPLPLSTLPAFSDSEAHPWGEEGVFLGTENMVSTASNAR